MAAVKGYGAPCSNPMGCVKILLLMALAVTASASNSRMVLADENDLPVCPESLPVTTTSVPGVDPILVLNAEGTRNFTCYNDVPDTYSEVMAKVWDTGNIGGNLYYDINGFPTFDIWFDPNTMRRVTLFKEFLEIPSPKDPSAYEWARYKVMSDTGSPAYDYVERFDTKDGAVPKTCWGGAAARMEFTSKFNFFSCKTKDAAPAPAPSTTTTVAPVPTPVAAVPSPTTMSPTPMAPAMDEPSPTPSNSVNSNGVNGSGSSNGSGSDSGAAGGGSGTAAAAPSSNAMKTSGIVVLAAGAVIVGLLL